jgi:hypothetical protein
MASSGTRIELLHVTSPAADTDLSLDTIIHSGSSGIAVLIPIGPDADPGDTISIQYYKSDNGTDFTLVSSGFVNDIPAPANRIVIYDLAAPVTNFTGLIVQRSAIFSVGAIIGFSYGLSVTPAVGGEAAIYRVLSPDV